MNLFQEMIIKFRDLIRPNEKYHYHPDSAQRDDQQHVMTEDEKLDETIEESMIASDPPGYISKSVVDKNLRYL